MAWTLWTWDMLITSCWPLQAKFTVHALHPKLYPCHILDDFEMFLPSIIGRLALASAQAPNGPGRETVTNRSIVRTRSPKRYFDVNICAMVQEGPRNGDDGAIDCTWVLKELLHRIKQGDAELYQVVYMYVSIYVRLCLFFCDFHIRGQLWMSRLLDSQRKQRRLNQNRHYIWVSKRQR